MKVKEKIEALNKQFQELGIDYQFDTRKKMKVYAVIHEVGVDVGDELWEVFDNKEEAEKEADRCLHSWRIEVMSMRVSNES